MVSLKKKIPFIFLFLCVICLLFGSIFRSFSSPLKRALKDSSYSYLPSEAIEYIEKVYYETGNLILTEKNKVENTPYLNPAYVDYLVMDSSKKEQIEEVPLPLTIDYVSTGESAGNLPSTYDLRNVDGKNYITPLKNQGNLDICWAFSALEQAESYLMVQNQQSYSSSSYVFSTRQLDYALSNNGIRNYTNDYAPPKREVGKGGNFLGATLALANGISMVSDDVMPFDLDVSQKELQDVLNYDNSLFELNSSIVFRRATYPYGSDEATEYLNKIKSYIMQYGGAYVSSQGPNYSCASRNSNGTYFVREDDNCTQDAGHAMQIIGWDDNYSYSYCKAQCTDSSGNTIACHSSNTSSCSSSNLVSGRGAWLVRNSWGEGTYAYIYLTYDSYLAANSSFYFSTDLTPMSERVWDNNYHTAVDPSSFHIHYSKLTEYTKPIDTVEKVEKVKFFSYGQDGTFRVSIYTDSQSYEYVDTIQVDYMGIATFDLSDYDIILTDPTFKVYVESTNSVAFIGDSISVYTSNYDSVPSMKYPSTTSLSSFYRDYSTTGYEFDLYSITKNIPSNEEILYELYDEEGNDVSSHLTYDYNKIASNNMNSIITVDGALPKGIYTLRAVHGDDYFLSYLILGVSYTLSGEGTTANPYLIHNESELRLMKLYLNSHFELESDIVLTKKWVPIGTYYEPFTGSINGNHHIISNLNIEGIFSDSAFLGYVKGLKDGTTSFQNIRFDNSFVRGNGNSAVFIGTLTGEEGYDWNQPYTSISLDNISIIGGSVYSYYGNAGSLVASIVSTNPLYHGTHRYNINRIFTSATVGGSSSSGMIGSIAGAVDSTYRTSLSMKNIENIGSIDLTPLLDSYTCTINRHSSVIGSLSNSVNAVMHYYILSPLFRGFTYSGNGIVGEVGTGATTNISIGYNTLDSTTTVLDLKNSSNYSSWPSFSSNWKMENIDSVGRIPLLMKGSITYNSLGDVTIGKGEEVLLSSLMETDSLIHFSYNSISDDEVVSVEPVVDSISNRPYDLKIKGLKGGTSTIHVYSNYDGYEKDLVVQVSSAITGFESDVDEVQIGVGDTYLFQPTILPSDTTDDTTITWISSDSSIATVDTTGLIQGVSLGTATITGTLSNGMSVSLTVTIIQHKSITSAVPSRNHVLLKPNENINLNFFFAPVDATENKNFTWVSEDSNVATIENNTVSAHGVGSTTIVGTLPDGLSVTIQVDVGEETTLKHGDFDSSGQVDIQDVIVALRKVFKYCPVDDVDLEVGDLNSSNSIGVDDVIILLRYVFKYISEI